MTNQRTVHPDLVREYRKTLYCCNVKGIDIKLEVGKVNKELSNILKGQNLTTAAFLTAYNPYSEIKSVSENEKSQFDLEEDIKNLGLEFCDGDGHDPDGIWSPEKSILIPGISQQQAEILADKYRQNAFIWINTVDAFVSLRLRVSLESLGDLEIEQWIATVEPNSRSEIENLSKEELTWLMTVSESELNHWLKPSQWDLNQTWPLSKPDGSTMGVGTELDRMFKLVAAGLQKIV
jgi:hypothetical protein